MTWTYTNRPAAVLVDAMRLLIGDTNENRSSEKLSDEELEFFASRHSLAPDTWDATAQYQSAMWACADALEALAGKYAKEASYSVGGMSEQANMKASETRRRARELRKQAAQGVMPVLTAVADENLETDTTHLPAFSRGMMEN